MTDDEMMEWGAYGRAVTLSSTPLSGMGPGEDIVRLWNLVGALEGKLREMASNG